MNPSAPTSHLNVSKLLLQKGRAEFTDTVIRETRYIFAVLGRDCGKAKGIFIPMAVCYNG